MTQLIPCSERFQRKSSSQLTLGLSNWYFYKAGIPTKKNLFVANGLSAMAYVIPGAVGLRLAQPQRPVLAIAGDGTLLMYAGDLATDARLGRPLVILVVVDQALSLIRLKQLRQELPVYGTEFNPNDYRAFGIEYRLIDQK